MKNTFVHMKTYFAGSIWRKRVLFSLIGALGGYAYYSYIGCVSGTCPITSNPYISTLYGAGIGFFLTIGRKKEASQATEQQQ